MRNKSETFRTVLYLFPRVLLVAFILLCSAIVIAGNFPLFEPVLEPIIGVYRGKVRQITSMITIGPYPHETDMRQLKQEGYDAVLCLLNTSLPQEQAMKIIEVKNAQRFGLAFYNVPLDYLNLESERNRKRLDEIAQLLRRERKKRFYIHCYLGRHRVELVRNGLIERGLIPK